MAELLLELFSEEIPARMQARAAEDLKRLVADGLAEAGLTFAKAEAFATPRRLALVIDGLPERQPDRREERKGPRVGAPEAAIAGFLRSAGLASLDQCEKRVVGKAEFWFAASERKGRATADVLAGLLGQAIGALPWPKSMRWAGNRFAWVRPLHGVVALFEGRVVAGGVALGESTVAFGATTRGHRFLSGRAIEVANVADYKGKLRAHRVILDAAERRSIIRRDADKAAAAEGLRVKDDPALLDEVAGLVEWPVVLVGSIDPAYMDLPAEVLTASMRAHQKYFALLTGGGALAPRFAVVANIETPDGGAAIVAGNERVLRARLSDAKFFWDQDRKVTLDSRLPALLARVFHARLGSMADKLTRVERLVRDVVRFVPGAEMDRARRAAVLAKADLSTGMVGEFPELQGTMGRYYALNDGEDPAVADAIRDHYAPAGPDDRCPQAPVSVAVALADRLDTLAGFWKIGELPTGSKDPYALRRAALGVIRLAVENKLRLPLREFFTAALLGHNVMLVEEVNRLAGQLLAFIADRLKVALREQGVRHDLIDAVFARGDEDDIVRLLARVEALKAFLGSDDGANLLTAFRRAARIVEIEEKKDGRSYVEDVDRGLLAEPEESRLVESLHAAREGTRLALGQEKFGAAMATLALLRGPVDAFFDRVTVNAPEPRLRANRLRLLSGIRRTLGEVADFSRVEG